MIDQSALSDLREAIVSGELSQGQRLIESDLMARFNAARGAIRQALVQLEGEGLVERVRNRGARVRPVSLEDAVEITEARAALEALCARRAARVATDADRDELRDIAAQMDAAVIASDVVRYSELAQDVHEAVRRISGQRTASAMIERLRYQSVRHHFSVALLPGRARVGLNEHTAIIDAVCAGSEDLAAELMRDHLMSVIDALRELDELKGASSWPSRPLGASPESTAHA